MKQDNEQYRAGFEAWAREQECVLDRDECGSYFDNETQTGFDAWCAAKREASTEPSAKAGPETPAGSSETRMDTGFEGGPKVAGALTDDAKDAARLDVFIDWYLREGSRSEVHLYGHMMPTTREIVLQWLDREAHTKAGSGK